MDCSVLIIGAGPAGSAAALTLARAGVDVLLADRCAFPRDKVCGDGLIADALTALNQLGLRTTVLDRARVLDGVRVYSPDGKFLDVDGECACLPRAQFDELLRAEAIRAGARFVAGVNARGALIDRDRVIGADFGSLQVHADMTLLATGAAAEPLKRFGVCHRVAPSATAARIYARTDETFARGFTHLCISYDEAICPGYGWIFPAPDATFNVGVAYFYDARKLPAERNVRKLLTRFVEKFPAAADVMRHAHSITALKGAPLRTALCGSELSRPGLLVLGEAAGLTYSFSGEGIGKALESGMLAAEAIIEFRGQATMPWLAADRYARRLREKFSTRFHAYKVAQDWLSRPVVANLLARRARRSAFVQRELAGLLRETTDPRRLFSPAGMLRSLLT